MEAKHRIFDPYAIVKQCGHVDLDNHRADVEQRWRIPATARDGLRADALRGDAECREQCQLSVAGHGHRAVEHLLDQRRRDPARGRFRQHQRAKDGGQAKEGQDDR
ncbi:MAG: hypothetical protein VW338_11430 [Rhodospirillaceae bacterium]